MAIAAVLSASPSHAQCTKDLDCKGERICQDGKCTEPPRAADAPAAVPEVTTATPEAAATVIPARTSTAAAAPSPLADEQPSLPNDSPSSAPTPAPEYKRRNRGLFAGGIVMVSLGTLALAVALVNGGSERCYDDGSVTVQRCERSPNYTAFVISGLLLGGGVPMVIIGGQRVPAKPQAGVSPWISRQGGGLQLQLTL